MMKITSIVVLVLALSACSTKFAYKNIDWLVYWYLDDYVELNKAQERQFDEALAVWMQWHKENELPKYFAQLSLLQQQVLTQQVSLQMIQDHRATALGHWQRFRAKIAPDLVMIAQSLDKDQVTYLFAALEKRNAENQEEIIENMSKNDTKRRDKRIRNILRDVTSWSGKLNYEQESLLENTFVEYQSSAQLWLDYQRDYQAALRRLFAQNDRGDEFAQSLYDLITMPEQFRSEDLLALNANNQRIFQHFLLALATLSTEKQREHFADELDDVGNDIQALML